VATSIPPQYIEQLDATDLETLLDVLAERAK
jgi:hypothetical protein